MMYNAPLVLSVSQLNRYVKSRMDADENLFNVFLVGEISNFTDHYKTGHFYFSLKDEEAQIKAVMFRQNALKVKFRPENGLRVIVRGRVSLYEAAGSYQVFVDDMQPDGVGALNLAFEQLKERLEREGLFDAAHKKPLPRFPERIGVITSETGAAVQDILNILGRRFPYAQVVLAPVLVQGEGAPAQLIDALQSFNAFKNVDIIILGRGGGSAEDLWAFNDERLAYAVYSSQIPVISAVGHETDFTICDFVADLRAPTPSAAAELAVPDQMQLRAEIHTLLSRMQRTVTNNLREQRLRLEQSAQKSVLKNPNLYFDTKRMQLLSVSTQFDALEKAILHRARIRLQESAAKLQALSPLSVLARGYSFTTLADGTVVHSANQLSENTEITVQLADGKAACTVKEIL